MLLAASASRHPLGHDQGLRQEARLVAELEQAQRARPVPLDIALGHQRLAVEGSRPISPPPVAAWRNLPAS